MKKKVKQILEGLTIMLILTACGGEPAERAESRSFSGFGNQVLLRLSKEHVCWYKRETGYRICIIM